MNSDGNGRGVAYVIAHCHLSDTERTFRLDRIRVLAGIDGSGSGGKTIDGLLSPASLRASMGLCTKGLSRLEWLMKSFFHSILFLIAIAPSLIE
jgi:hypothetical protein